MNIAAKNECFVVFRLILIEIQNFFLSMFVFILLVILIEKAKIKRSLDPHVENKTRTVKHLNK